ncbi:MAG: formate dehydrogenase, partial [Janthinobacterium lividum]
MSDATNAGVLTLYVPRDAAAIAVGADEVAAALASAAQRSGRAFRLVRNGSRGMHWLEPLVEVETAEGRVGFGGVTVEDVASVMAAILGGGAHKLGVGLVEEIPFLARQQRLTFKRCGITDPLSIEDYRAHGGYVGLAKALEIGGEETIAQVLKSGLRGRGGAGFPTGIKWRGAAMAKADQRYVVCNADE